MSSAFDLRFSIVRSETQTWREARNPETENAKDARSDVTTHAMYVSRFLQRPDNGSSDFTSRPLDYDTGASSWRWHGATYPRLLQCRLFSSVADKVSLDTDPGCAAHAKPISSSWLHITYRRYIYIYFFSLFLPSSRRRRCVTATAVAIPNGLAGDEMSLS